MKTNKELILPVVSNIYAAQKTLEHAGRDFPDIYRGALSCQSIS